MLGVSKCLTRAELLVCRQVRTTVWGDGARQHVKRALKLQGEVLIEQPPGLLRNPLNGVASRLIHCSRPSIHDHFLSGADQPRTLLSNAIESGVV